MLPVVLLFGFTMIMNQITLSDSAAFGGLQAGDDPVLLQGSLYQVVPVPAIALAVDGMNHTPRGSGWRTGIAVGAPFGLLVTGPRPDFAMRGSMSRPVGFSVGNRIRLLSGFLLKSVLCAEIRSV